MVSCWLITALALSLIRVEESIYPKMSFLKFVASYLKTQQAWQWWSKRQSMHLFQESHQIRDQLLQESFIIRRNIEQDLANGVALSPENSQAWLEQLQQFHNSLEKLSDRLVPAYTEDSVPIAIQHLTQTWQSSYHQLKFLINLPQNWQPEQPEISLITIQLLEELFKILIKQKSTQALIVINLKQCANVNKLKIQVTYFEQPELIKSANFTDLENLGETFRVLTSGQCYYYPNNLQLTCNFSW